MNDRVAKYSSWSVVITLGLTFIVFLLSWFFPVGISYGVLYLAILLPAASMHSPQVIWKIAYLMMLLLTASTYHHLPKSTSTQLTIDIANLGLRILAVWLIAYLATRIIAKRNEILELNAGLDQKVREGRRELEDAISGLREEVYNRERMNADLEYQNMLLDGLMDAIPDNIYFKDLEGRYLRINRAKALSSGLKSPLDAVGKTDYDYFLEEHARSSYEVESRIIETGKPLIDHEEKLVWPNGRITWVSTTKVPLKRADGKVIGTLGISRDITNHVEISQTLQLERDRLRTLIDHLPDFVFIKDAEARFVTVNRALYELYGCHSEAEVIGKTDFDFSSPENSERYYRDDMEVIRTGKMLTGRDELAISAEGETHWLLTTKVPLRALDGRVVGLVGIARDITQRKLAEQELTHAKEAAEVANRAKSEFLANMSHEIRTPMNAIIGMTELVLDTPLQHQQKDYLETVLSSAESLMGIINDILDFSKIESGRLEIENYPVDLREWLGDSIKPLALRAHAKKLELAYHVSPAVPQFVRTDGLRLRQIIVNLLGNAIKFTRYGEVVLDVQFLKSDSIPDSNGQSLDRIHLQVSDTGIGIAPEQQKRVFEAFEQEDMSTTRTYGGTGLGLAISSRLTQLMGGKIWVESVPGEGSTFHVIVPIGPVRPEEITRTRLDVSALTGVRIMIVDDNATNRKILEEMCLNWRMRPTVVSGANEALTELKAAQSRQESYDLIITDASMPEVDGFTLAEEIQKDPSFEGMLVMMLSSLDRQMDIKRCNDMGIRSYLTKPIKQSDLFDAIANVLDLSVKRIDAAKDDTVDIPAIRPLKILLAEDSLANRKLAIGLLSRWGHQIDVAVNGEEAVHAIVQKRYDVVLMDVQMPEMDGLTATRAIRRREATGNIPFTPIIALTAHAMKGDRERCLEAGMDDYITKPIRPLDLATVLARFGLKQSNAVQEQGTAQQQVFGTITESTDQENDPQAPHAENGQHFDWGVLLEFVQHDQQLAVDVAQAFLFEVPRQTSSLMTAIANQDQSKAKIAAHTLKGNLRTLGAPSSEIASEIEIAAAANDWNRCIELQPQLASSLELVIQDVTAHVEGRPVD